MAFESLRALVHAVAISPAKQIQAGILVHATSEKALEIKEAGLPLNQQVVGSNPTLPTISSISREYQTELVRGLLRPPDSINSVPRHAPDSANEGPVHGDRSPLLKQDCARDEAPISRQ